MNKDTQKGFTLIELLVAAVIIGILSIISTTLLFDTISIREKHQAIAASSDEGYLILEQLAREIRHAKSIDIPGSNRIDITLGSKCVSYMHDSLNSVIERAEDTNPPCSPSTYSDITPSDIKITGLVLSPVGSIQDNVNIVIEGEVENSFGGHEFQYSTSVIPRISI